MIKNVERVLSHLGEQLELRDAPSTRIVVCGGAALNVLGFVSRTTRDVDILAEYDDTTNSAIKPSLSEVFRDAAEVVGEEFELDEDWINTEPSSMVKTGLPVGLEERLTFKEYGDRLTVGFIDRIDQIFLKCWASVDHDPNSYHVDDLKKLEPSDDEIKNASRWCLKQDPGIRPVVTDMLHKLEFDDVAESL